MSVLSRVMRSEVRRLLDRDVLGAFDDGVGGVEALEY